MAGEWLECTLGDLIDVKHGFAFQGEFIHNEPQGDILLTPGNFAVGGGFKGDRFKYYDGPVPEDFVLVPGDLLVTMTDLSKESDTLGFPAFVPSCSDGRRYLHNQRLGKIQVKDPSVIEISYLHSLLRSAKYRHEVLASATGTTVKHTSPERIHRYRFLRPPLSEQRAIAHILGTLDDKIELNRRMNATLEAVARAIFKDWFIDFGPTRAKQEGRAPYLASDIWSLFPDRLDDEGKPAGWNAESVYDQAIWVNGAAYKDMHFSFEPGALPVVKITELKSGITKTTRFTNTDLGERYKIRGEELLFSWSGNPDTSIDTFIWPSGDAWLNQHIFAVRPNGKRSQAFLYVMLKFLRSEFAEIARNKQTTGLGHITQQDLIRLKITAPSKDVQTAFDEIIGPPHSRFTNNLFENQALIATRDFLLSKLMSGEIRVKDAETFIGGGK